MRSQLVQVAIMGSLGGPGGRFFFVFLVFFGMSMNAKKTRATTIYHKLIFTTLNFVKEELTLRERDPERE